jgi:hypothetical protein
MITSWMSATTFFFLAKNPEIVASVLAETLSESLAVCASNSARNASISSSHQCLVHEDCGG